MATLFGLFPSLKLYADGGYQGAQFQDALGAILKRVNVEIVKRSDQAQRFVVLPKRWIVERTFAWLGRCRRLAKDWECLNRKALAFLKLASIRLMTRNYAIQDDVSGQTLTLIAQDHAHAPEFLQLREPRNEPLFDRTKLRTPLKAN